MSSAAIIILIACVVIAFSWQILSSVTISPSLIKLIFKNNNNNNDNNDDDFNIVLVFAHPDDEAMFFTPTLHALKDAQRAFGGGSDAKNSLTVGKKIKFHFVCLTRGNYDKLGAIREKEMHASAKFYGAASCTVIEDPRCQDGPDEKWDQDFIVKEVIKKKIISELKADVVLTFDDFGVSGHKNHRDTSAIVLLAHTEIVKNKQNNEKVPKFYKLVSLPIWRKYSSIFGVLLRNGFEQINESISGTAEGRNKNSLAFVLPPGEGFQSMRGLWNHRSQFVWFRFFYVLLASYSYENILEEF